MVSGPFELPMNQQQHPTQIPRCHVLVPCAGMGQRALLPGASRPKQYALLEGLPLVTHTLQALSQVDPGAASDGAWQQGLRVAVVAPNDELWAKLVAPVAIGWRTAPVGGASRAESVLNGLQFLYDNGDAKSSDWVLVHDAARCLIQAQTVHTLIHACVKHKRGGLLAQPVPDTIKVARQEMLDGGVAAVADTVARAGKWLAQTPQLFNLSALLSALRDAQSDEQAWPLITDEASAMERLGQSPLLVASGVDNFKVTFSHDFALAGVMLRGRTT